MSHSRVAEKSIFVGKSPLLTATGFLVWFRGARTRQGGETRDGVRRKRAGSILLIRSRVLRPSRVALDRTTSAGGLAFLTPLPPRTWTRTSSLPRRRSRARTAPPPPPSARTAAAISARNLARRRRRPRSARRAPRRLRRRRRLLRRVSLPRATRRRHLRHLRHLRARARHRRQFARVEIDRLRRRRRAREEKRARAVNHLVRFRKPPR